MTSLTDKIRQLREQTGAGMVDCKNALAESGGDLEQASELLRKKGAAIAAKKAGRIAADGMLAFSTSATGKGAVLVEVNSETDFVAKNEQFIAFADDLARALAESPLSRDEELANLILSDGVSVAARVETLIAKIGEKISVRRFVKFETQSPDESVVAYMHPGNKIGVMVKASGSSRTPQERGFLRDVAMHIAAMSPLYLSSDAVSPERLAKEKEIFAAQLEQENKPAAIVEKILQGKLAKFKKEVSLLDQVFVKDPEGKKTVSEWMTSQFPGLKLVQFTRLQVGEGIEKKSENFADEVARQGAQSSH